MGRSVQAFFPFVPPTVTHNDLEAYTFKRGGKTVAGIRKSDRLKDAEDLMWPYVRRMVESSACCPLSGAVRETVKICWPTMGRHDQGEPMTDAPDIDNFIKTFNDICQRCGAITNDSHVAELKASKAWVDPAGVFVRFEEIG